MKAAEKSSPRRSRRDRMGRAITVNLTARAIENWKPDPAKRLEVWQQPDVQTQCVPD
jgi:hypothetical protein